MNRKYSSFKEKILLIDDEFINIRLISEDLRNLNYDLISAQTGYLGLELAQHDHPNLILLDVILPDISGFEVCRILKSDRHTRAIPVIFLSVLNQIHDKIQGFDAGGADFVSKPFDREELLARIRAHLKHDDPEKFKADTTPHFGKSGSFETIMGASPVMKKVFQRIIRAASSKETVLIYGETGSGKELAARLIYSLGANNEAFIAVNCGAIPENLCESVFFGYRKGAFTGASGDASGYFDQAKGGVLFLDEVGELSPAMQIKLLRVLEQNTYMPLGSALERAADVRIIAATNRNLKAMVAEGRMREDFFHRINIIPILMPPLRDHKEDIPLLIRHFLMQNSIETQEIPDAVTERFYAYDWPGNVRELFNELRRFIITGEIELGGYCRSDNPSLSAVGIFSEGKSYHDIIEDTEKRLIADALIRAGHHIGKTAEFLKIPLRTLHRKIRKYGL